MEVILKQVILRLESIIRPINRAAYSLSKIVLFLLMLLTFFDIFGRNLLNNPITGTFELTGLALVTIVFLSLGMTQIHKEHIDIDFLVQKFPHRMQAGLNTLIYLTIFIFLIIVSRQLLTYTERVFIGNEVSSVLGLPIYIFTVIAMLGMIIFTLSIMLDLLKSLLKVVAKNES